MYYKPNRNIFTEEEFFPRSVVYNHKLKDTINRSIWRLMDGRVIWTAVQLRNYFGTMIINDYKWGGKNQYRGYRPSIEIIDFKSLNKVRSFKALSKLEPKFSSFTSQHCFGRAVDAKFRMVSAEEVREDIRKNQYAERYKYITAIENNVDWLHFDVRNWGKDKFGILFFSL